MVVSIPKSNLILLKSIFCSLLFLSVGCSDGASSNNASNNGTNNGTIKPTNNNNGTSNKTSSTTETSGTTTPDDGTPKISNLPTIEFVAVKLFRFGWDDVSDATYYQILENPDGKSDFVQVGDDIQPGIKTFDIEVPLYLRTNAIYKLRSCNMLGCTDSDALNVSGNLVDAIGYFKAENAGIRDTFGGSIALSADGKMLVVGAPKESSRDINDETDDAWKEAGAVYVFTQTNGKWTQQAFLKASNADMFDLFGSAIALNGPGDVLVVSAIGEDGRFANDSSDNSRIDSGAVYVFERTGSTWTETHYLKLEQEFQGVRFGQQLALSTDGNTLIVRENNPFTTGISVNHFTKTGDQWILQPGFGKPDARITNFGISIAMDGTGSVIAIGANQDSSDAVGIGGDPDNQNRSRSGAVFLYELENGAWTETYIKSDMPLPQSKFGGRVRLSGDGLVLAVIGDGKLTETDTETLRFVYIYRKKNGIWGLEKKFPSVQFGGYFDMSLNEDGTLIALSSIGDQAASAGLDGDRTAEPGGAYGAVFIHSFENESWEEIAYVKSSNPGKNDNFGLNILLGKDGTLVVGVPFEGGGSTGVDGAQDNDDAEFSGAVYLY